MANRRVYLQKTISLESKDIRLLHLLPVYEALSYAWGDPEVVRPILLDGEQMDVTINLESALRHLRFAESTRILWVDALSINQKAIVEKTHQVGMMDEIYKQCSRVIIWLDITPIPTPQFQNGPIAKARKALLVQIHRGISAMPMSSLTSKWAFRSRLEEFVLALVQKLNNVIALFCNAGDYTHFNPFVGVDFFADDKHFHELPCFYRRVFAVGKYPFRFYHTQAYQSMWDGIASSFDARWWSRLWCVQEAILPREAVVRSGKYEVSWDRLRSAACNLIRHAKTCCTESNKHMPRNFGLLPDNLLVAQTQNKARGPTLESRTPQSMNDGNDEDLGNSLDRTLRLYRYKDCKDPRDKVYGTLGLVDRTAFDDVAQALLTPDYSRSLRDVFCGAATAIARQSRQGNLRFLTGEGFNRDHSDLPSWVRDLAYRPDETTLWYEMERLKSYDLYNAWKPGSDQALTDHSPHVRERMLLSLLGVCCNDEVGKVIQVAGYTSSKHAWDVIGDILGWLRVAGLKVPFGSRPFKAPAQQAFWRTLVANLVMIEKELRCQRLDDGYVGVYEDWLSSAISSWRLGRMPPLDGRFIEALHCATYGRGLFVTEKGNVGLCHPGVKSGDEIWVLKGGRVPFILRKQLQSHGGHEPTRYRLVGDCYLDGVMDGEVFKAKPAMTEILLE
uniref:Heterokaryon incompatibility domain-containing protein n=1 Tax=Colletotrichum fructicola (strain Nara gc5) TaxID=1213859 RepID=L2FGN4_COLFN